MLFAVISDIHGCAIALERALDLCENTFHADCYLLLGDLLYHGPRNRIADGYDAGKTSQMLNSIRGRVIAVRGNCDAEVDQMMLQFPITADCNQIPFCGHRIFMTHGHLYNENNWDKENTILIFGHYHIPFIKEMGNNLYMNPGSISRPQDGFLPSYMIWDEKKFTIYDVNGTILAEKEMKK